MSLILFNKCRFVKFIFLLTILSAYAENSDLSEKAFHLELIVYQQPEIKAFGSIQPAKYLNFIQPQSKIATQLPSHIAYEDSRISPTFKKITEQLARKSIPFATKSYVIRLDKQQSTTVPLELSVSTPIDPEKPSNDHILLQGALTMANNLYLDVTSQLCLSQYRGDHIAFFDHIGYTRHLKIDKTQYLDNEAVGILLRVSHTNFDATRLLEYANSQKPKKDNPEEQLQEIAESSKPSHSVSPRRNAIQELAEQALQPSASQDPSNDAGTVKLPL